jgi:hypothetical protein
MQDAFTTAQFSEAGRKINEDFDLRLAAKRCGDNAVVLAKLRQIHADTDRVQFLMQVMLGIGLACLFLMFIIAMAVL